MNQDLRILLVEDSVADADLEVRQLRQAGLVFVERRASSREGLLVELESFKPDLVLSDYNMPGFDGLEALAIVREKRPETPFLFVSGSIGEDRAIEALKKGATDYVLKDRMERLVPCVQRAVRETAESEQRRRMEEQLLQSEKMASVGLLIGGVAHELNNPLTAILGHAQLLMMEAEPSGQIRADLAVIQREANRCKRLMTSLLSFARKHEHKLVPSSLSALISEIVDLKTYDFRRAGVTLVREEDPGLPVVTVDPNQIQQVLLNLLNNAEHALEKSKGSVRVVTRRDGGDVLLEVADDGPGIAPENLPRVFEPFFTTKEPGKGTGLGLSICSKIVTDHGGALTVDSSPGRGARFTVRLPVSSPGSGGDAGASCEAARPGAALVVEDEEEVLRFLARTLRQLGWQVEPCASLGAALKLLDGRAFDLVVTDYDMPEMDGKRFYDEAVKLRPGLGKRFILLTGKRGLEGVERIRREGRMAVLEKPFELVEFAKLVRAMIQPEGR